MVLLFHLLFPDKSLFQFHTNFSYPLCYFLNFFCVFLHCGIATFHGFQHKLMVQLFDLTGKLQQFILVLFQPFIAFFHQFFMLLQGTGAGLVIGIILNHSSHFHGVLCNQIIIAPHYVSTGLFGFPDQLLIKIRCDPVVTIDKANPFTRGHF